MKTFFFFFLPDQAERTEVLRPKVWQELHLQHSHIEMQQQKEALMQILHVYMTMNNVSIAGKEISWFKC